MSTTTHTRTAEAIIADQDEARSRGDEKRPKELQNEYRSSGAPIIRYTGPPMQLREGSNSRSSTTTTTATTSRAAGQTSPQMFATTRALPKIDSAPVGWATFSHGAYRYGLMRALDDGLAGAGIEGGGALFGTYAADCAVRVEQAGTTPAIRVHLLRPPTSTGSRLTSARRISSSRARTG